MIVGASIFVGLPLFGWGINNASKFINHPVRLLYVIIIILLQFFAIIYNPKTAKKKESRTKRIVKSKLDLILIQIFSLAIVFIAPYSDSHAIFTVSSGNIIRYLGLILVMAGFILMQLAEKYLARQFSVEVTIQEDHQLVTNGPYKYLRHPRYLGIMVFFFGISFVFQSFLAMGVVVALSIVLVWRVFAEERLMRQEFKQEWDDYCANSW
ncbi:MAG: isoprenylcysteine carboxylmethyltransferase family protein [Deltaproteobacteria bacterium]|nr:isoprenylcysteine carboxylmethyltransferase family protein [Deltaproteobacteria bacterium]